jgi:hypothetical protein
MAGVILAPSPPGEPLSGLDGPHEPISVGIGWSRRLRQPETLITLLVVACCTVFVFVELQPSQLLRNTTPAGGDMGAHVWLPAYIKRQLLPHFQIFGWTMDWYAGFPALTYYFPLPMVTIALTSYVIPYNIAFKLVTVAGLIALPVCCFALGRLARMRFPGPACLAIAATAYLFNRDFKIYGGNIASTMSGEFSFSISLALAVLFLGLVARGMSTGRNRALAAVVLALCGLSHILPLFFAIGGGVVLWVMTFDLKRLVRWSLPVGLTGGLLIAFWALPYEYRLPYATNMGYGKITAYLSALSPPGDLWLLILAAVGALLALIRRNRIGTFLLITTVGAAITFRFGPSDRLWNARWLPFWFLGLYLLAGVAFAETGSIVVALVRRRRERDWLLAPVPIITLLVALVWVGLPLRILPFGHVDATTKAYNWMGITTTDHSFIPDWVRWDYSGYQSDGKSSRAAYFALITEMDKLGHTAGDGCGRVMYQYEPALNDMGTSDALMLLPYWTDGCIATIEGLYYESSATTPYHFLDSAELSPLASNPMRDLAYPDDLGIGDGTQLAEGIDHLQMLGIKYFMAVTPSVQRQAAADKSLRYLTEVGPYPTHVSVAGKSEVENQTWRIYKILDSPLVEPLANQPVVMRDTAGTKWLGRLTSDAGTPTPAFSPTEAWYLHPSRWDVYETSTGPASWPRVSATDGHPPRKREPKAHVTHIVEKEESISFDVDRTGVPILVKVSYFPNWHVTGAKHIYRVTPNLMLVVPTATHVSLTYGYTPIDWAGLILSLLGVLAVVVLWKRRNVEITPHPSSAD